MKKNNNDEVILKDFTIDILKQIIPPAWHDEIYAPERYCLYPQAKETLKSTFCLLIQLWRLCNWGEKYGWNGMVARYTNVDIRRNSIPEFKNWLVFLKQKYDLDLINRYELIDKTGNINLPMIALPCGAGIYFRPFDYDKISGTSPIYGDFCDFYLDEAIPKKNPEDIDIEAIGSDFVAITNTLLRSYKIFPNDGRKDENGIPLVKKVWIPYNVWRPDVWVHTMYVLPNFPLTDDLKTIILRDGYARYTNKYEFSGLGLRIFRAMVSKKINPYVQQSTLDHHEFLLKSGMHRIYDIIKNGFESIDADGDIWVHRSIVNKFQKWDKKSIKEFDMLILGCDIGGTFKSRRSKTSVGLIGLRNYDRKKRKFKEKYVIQGLTYDVKKANQPLTEKQKALMIIQWIKLLIEPYIETYNKLIYINCSPEKSLWIEEINEKLRAEKIKVFAVPAINKGYWCIDNRTSHINISVGAGGWYFNQDDWYGLREDFMQMQYDDKGGIDTKKQEYDDNEAFMYCLCRVPHLI